MTHKSALSNASNADKAFALSEPRSTIMALSGLSLNLLPYVLYKEVTRCLQWPSHTTARLMVGAKKHDHYQAPVARPPTLASRPATRPVQAVSADVQGWTGTVVHRWPLSTCHIRRQRTLWSCCRLLSRQWVSGSWVIGQMGQQMWMGHVGHGSVTHV